MNFSTVNNPAMILVYTILVILIVLIITRIITFLTNRMNRFKKDMTAPYLIRDMINFIIYFAALMVILQFFGINLTGTILSLGIVGIALSFAAKDLISNLFSGIILIIGKSLKVGDTIKINGEKGVVERISVRTTVIVDDLGVKNIVPNSIITNNNYLHYKPPEKYRVDIIVGLPLNVDVEEFKDYIIGKMKSYAEIAENPNPNVFAKEIKFNESRVKVSFWVKHFNRKDEYKIIITNEIRKYIEMGENDE